MIGIDGRNCLAAPPDKVEEFNVNIKADTVHEQYREAMTDTVTDSGIPLKPVYTAEDVRDLDLERQLGLPGEFPFTRGHHPQMYRGKLWNIRQITGLSTPEENNRRMRMQLDEGAGALTYHPDGITLYGMEPDQPGAAGKLGVTGVISNRLADVEKSLDGLPLDAVSICPGCTTPLISQSILLAVKKRGYDLSQFRLVDGWGPIWLPMGYISLKNMTFAKGQLSTFGKWGFDFWEYLLRNMPKAVIYYFDGPTAFDGGATAIQEAAFILSSRDAVLRGLMARGLDVNAVAAVLSPTISLGRDFFENIAKIRALRRVWAKTLRDDFGVTNPKALPLRLHANTMGSLCTMQQPRINLVRVAVAALSGVLSGVSGLQLAAYDETFATPSEDALLLSIRSNQVLRYETGVGRVADPLGGSYFVESLTSRMEEEIVSLYRDMDARGGWLKLLENGWVHEVMSKNSWDMQRKIESGERVVVGVNRFQIPPEVDVVPEVFSPETGHVDEYVADYVRWREDRPAAQVKSALDALAQAAEKGENLVEPVNHALEAEATFAEIIGTLRQVDGLEWDWAGERKYPF
jgi:methylmalonyl-CoA mutase N-terminal domain/subunit